MTTMITLEIVILDSRSGFSILYINLSYRTSVFVIEKISFKKSILNKKKGFFM